MSKKDTIWKIDVNNLSVSLLQGFLLLFFDKRDDFANKYEEFYNPSIQEILTIINGMPHQLFAAGLQARDIYPEIKKYFYREHSNMTWEEFLTTKFGLWIHVPVLTTLFTAVAGQWKKVVYYFRLKKHQRIVMVILHAMRLTLKIQWHT